MEICKIEAVDKAREHCKLLTNFHNLKLLSISVTAFSRRERPVSEADTFTLNVRARNGACNIQWGPPRVAW